MGPPVERSLVDEPGAHVDEVALELDPQPGLLEPLALDRGDEVLARLDARRGRPPDVRREDRLADQG